MNKEILFKAKRKDIEYEVIGNILMIKSCWRWNKWRSIERNQL